MKRIAVCFFALVLVIICCTACGSPDNGDIKIEAGALTLYYPAEWKDDVFIESSEDAVTFSAGEGGAKLFSLLFNSKDEGDYLGTVKTKDEEITLSVLEYELNKSDDTEKNRAMKDDISYLLSRLKEDYTFSVEQKPQESEEEDVFEIQASPVCLYYPTKWQTIVDIGTEENLVAFSCHDTKLFDIAFGGSKGDLLGVYNGETEIRIIPYDLPEDSDDMLNEMQDDVSVIIAHLEEDPLFSVANGGV